MEQQTPYSVLYHYLVQDTPGYGDTTTPTPKVTQHIIEYVINQQRRHWEAEHSPSRTCAMADMPDGRVDVALLLLPPHKLRQADVNVAVQLSAVCPVVPLLAKADCMTREELDTYRRHVWCETDKAVHSRRHTVHSAVLGSAGKRVVHTFSSAALDEAGVRRGCPPFAVVGAATMDLRVGRCVVFIVDP